MIQQSPEAWSGTGAISHPNLRRALWRALPREWMTVYRYHGLVPLMRCLLGTNRLVNLDQAQRNDQSLIDWVSFTVIPEISLLWTAFLRNALDEQNNTVLLGDGYGNFPKFSSDMFEVLPIFNFNHGIKLDLVMQKACHAEYVLVCDDDIFWLNDEPLKYALHRFSENSKLAVLSFHPRPEKNSQLVEYVGQPMGSYCLLIKRSVWLKEALSFKYYKPTGSDNPIFFFDTADYANLLLLQKGYDVEVAPDEVRNNLVTFYGTSMWGIKILTSRGDITKIINPTRPDEHKKLYRTALALKGFQDLLSMLPTNCKFLIKRSFLDRVEMSAKKGLDKFTIQEVDADLSLKLDRMKSLLKCAKVESWFH